jgi:hypothetical protein
MDAIIRNKSSVMDKSERAGLVGVSVLYIYIFITGHVPPSQSACPPLCGFAPLPLCHTTVTTVASISHAKREYA